MHTNVKNIIESKANDNPNEEICGFVYHDFNHCDVLQCDNISIDKHSKFEISSIDFISCLRLGKILAIYHSHPADQELELTPDDIRLSDDMNLPIRMYHVGSKEWREYYPASYKINMEGMDFIWGEQDCFGLARTFFRQEHGIYVNDYPRDDSFQNSDNNVIMESLEKEGWYNVGATTLLKKHDVLLFQVGRAVVQHFGIFLGNSRMLHHPLNSLSKIDLLNQKWLNRLRYVLRNKTIEK